jgi:DNA-binding NtrC family response regulator
MEDELFGHEKGAFTDARSRKVGLIEAADGGTLFLDEIGEMELSLQAKLLRVLENFRVRPIGSVHDRRVNVRIVAATNRDLAREAQAGRFRSDLVYRLSVFQIRIPPLRERGDDVMLLAGEFLKRLASRYGRPALRFNASAQAALRGYPWPGNVRELFHVLERAAVLCGGEVVDLPDLPENLRATTGQGPPIAAEDGLPLREAVAALERRMILRALERAGGNRSEAARQLGIGRPLLYAKMEQYGLAPRGARDPAD